MATYIKGADTYLPDIKPFTPDYKFLSAVLETKTDKYDSNFKATNDLYNKVVYADLSRVDNKDKRDQYAQTIGPAIEKISGMDLSLQQNADQAQSVFAPFYEDDLVVKDIVYTSAYRKEQALAQRLLDQGTDKAVERYSERGKRSLQYQMDDFINADPQKALNMKLPKYVQAVNLKNMSDKILADSGLSMKMDQMSDDGNFIITRKNGALVTGAALQVLQQTLVKDPRVQAAYADDAFVASRDFAANGIQAGAFTSVSQGQAAWADETIRRINEKNEINITKDLEKQQEQINANVNWENYQANNGIIPGSDMALALEQQMSIAEATQASLDARMGIRREAALPTDNLDGNLNKAYRLLMQSNIQGDLISAAVSYGARDQELTFRENKYALEEQRFKYDMAKIKAKALNDRLLAIEKGEIMDPNNPNSLGNKLQNNKVVYGDATTIDAAVNKDGELDPNIDMIQRNNTQFITEDNKIFTEQVEDVLQMLQLMYPTGDSGLNDQTYGLEFGTGIQRGDVQTLRNLLLTTDGDNPEIPSYKYRNDVTRIFESMSQEFKDTREQTLKDPNLTMGSDRRTQYDKQYTKMFGLNGTVNKIAGLNQFMKSALQNHADAYKLVEKEVYNKDGGDNNAMLMKNAGFPPIMNEQNQMLTQKEYIDLVKQGINAGNITNPDLGGWTWDTGTSNKDYMIDASEMVREYDAIFGQYVERAKPIYNNDGSRAKMLDERAVEDEAIRYYELLSQPLNRMLNSGNIASADLYATAYGRSDAKGSDVYLSPSYEYSLNPLSPNPAAEFEMGVLIDQVKTLDRNNTGYGIVQGDINLDKGKNKVDPSLLLKDPTAVKVWNLYLEDLNTWFNNPKRSNSDAIAPISTLKYMPVIGQAKDADKDQAGYQILFSPEWLASKVKMSGVENQYGALTMTEVGLLSGQADADGVAGQGGITFVFDQKDDINTKSRDNLYYSSVETAILAGNNGYAEFNMPEGLSNTSTYRIIKTGTNDYNIHYSINTYQPGGTYTTRTETQPIDMSGGLRGLDIHVMQFNNFLETKREQNRIAREKDNADKGKK